MFWIAAMSKLVDPLAVRAVHGFRGLRRAGIGRVCFATAIAASVCPLKFREFDETRLTMSSIDKRSNGSGWRDCCRLRTRLGCLPRTGCSGKGFVRNRPRSGRSRNTRISRDDVGRGGCAEGIGCTNHLRHESSGGAIPTSNVIVQSGQLLLDRVIVSATYHIIVGSPSVDVGYRGCYLHQSATCAFLCCALERHVIVGATACAQDAERMKLVVNTSCGLDHTSSVRGIAAGDSSIGGQIEGRRLTGGWSLLRGISSS